MTGKRVSLVLFNVDRKTLSVMGKKLEDRDVIARNDGVGAWPAISTLSESAARAGNREAGTDSGTACR